MVRTESDPWMWITSHPAQLDRLLLSPALPGRTKYKLGLSSDTNGDLVIKSVCFFCNNGSPQVIQHLLYQNLSYNFFPDYTLNLNGYVVRITIPAITAKIEANPPPYDGLRNAKRGVWKYLFEEYLMVKMNFTYNIFISSGKNGKGSGGGTGAQLSNGTWIGM